MKRRRLGEWVLALSDGTIIAAGANKDFGHVAPDERVVKMVEHQPTADAVVRAATALVRPEHNLLSFDSRVNVVMDAVEKHLLALEKGRK